MQNSFGSLFNVIFQSTLLCWITYMLAADKIIFYMEMNSGLRPNWNLGILEYGIMGSGRKESLYAYRTKEENA